MDSRAIGVFDSGLGGLCAVRELEKLLPKERIIYFGDTGRVPYGTKSDEIIKKIRRAGCKVFAFAERQSSACRLRNSQLGCA